jgi:hypothetical protein
MASILLAVRLLLCLVFAGTLAVLAISGQAGFVLPAWLPYGAAASLPAYAAILAAAVLGGLATAALTAGWSGNSAPNLLRVVELIRHAPLIAFACVWLLLVLPIAAVTNRLALLPMSLGLGAACAAAVAAQRTGEMLRDGGKLELQHDILGIGGGLGGWRMSEPAGTAVLSLVLLGTAAALSMAGLPAAAERKPAEKPAACNASAKPPAPDACPAEAKTAKE